MKTKTSLFLILLFAIMVFAKPIELTSKYGVLHKSNKCQITKKKFGNGDVYTIKIFKNKMNYKVDTNNSEKVDFYLNSNFFTPTSPIGEAIVNGKVVNDKVKRGGYFTSNGGAPRITLNDRPSARYSTQTKYVTIKNGVLNNSRFVSGLSKWKTHRTLLGEDKEGNLIIIHSGVNGLVSVRDITLMGKSEGMVNALMFDGGSSIEVLVKDGNFKHNYHSVSDKDKIRFKIHKPFVYITGKFI